MLQAHVCVQQTVIDLLLENDIEVHVVADATSSRSQQDRLLALQVTILNLTRLELLAGVCGWSAFYRIMIFELDFRLVLGVFLV